MTISRRDLLKSGLAIAGISYGWKDLLMMSAQAAEIQTRKPNQKVLVIVQLAGGNDGLNTVIPYGNGTYYQVRPTIGIKQDQVLPLNGQIGLNPNLKPLFNLYQQRKVAVLQGLGYPSANLSHFRSIEIWQTASPERIIDTGWLGRYLDLASPEQKMSENIFPAVNVDPILPKTLSARKAVIPSVYDLNQFKFATDAHYQQDNKCQVDTFNKLYTAYSDNAPSVELVKKVGLDALKSSDYLRSIVNDFKVSVNYPDSAFARSLKFIAQMIRAGVSATVYNVSLGGFDTHSGQVNGQSRLLKQFAEGIAAFQQDLEAHKLDQDVIVMTFSEFGRRVAQNNGNGTDHGTANCQFIIGSSVRGGLYGDYPSLTDLDNGNLKYRMDFRQVYSTILDHWLKADSRQILGGQFPAVPFL